MIKAKKLIPISLLISGMAATAAPMMLPEGKAPFKNETGGSVYIGDAELDQKTLTWNYGSKQLKINPDGTFAVLSNGRRLARTYFFIATPYKYWQTNGGGAKKAGEYEGKRIEVRDIKIEGNKITFSGLVPWQKAGEKTLAAPWSMSVVSDGKGRFSFFYTYEIPEGRKLLDRGIFMEITNIKQMDAGDAGIWIPKDKKNIHSFKPTVLNFAGNVQEDNFRVESNSWTTQNVSVRFNFRFGKKRNQPSFVIDLGK